MVISLVGPGYIILTTQIKCVLCVVCCVLLHINNFLFSLYFRPKNENTIVIFS